MSDQEFRIVAKPEAEVRNFSQVALITKIIRDYFTQ